MFLIKNLIFDCVDNSTVKPPLMVTFPQWPHLLKTANCFLLANNFYLLVFTDILSLKSLYNGSSLQYLDTGHKLVSIHWNPFVKLVYHNENFPTMADSPAKRGLH